MIRRRRIISIALAVAAHTTIFCLAGAWLNASIRPMGSIVEVGGMSMEFTIDAEAPPRADSSPAAPGPVPPPAAAPREARVEEPHPLKPVEPVKEPEPEPVQLPEPKPLVSPAPEPVVTKEEPVVPEIPPVVAQAQPAKPADVVAERKGGVAERKGGVVKMDEMAKTVAAAPSAPVQTPGTGTGTGAGVSGQGAPTSDSNASGMAGGPAPVSTIHPRYPMGSRIRGEEGPVLLRTRVDDRGRPVEVTVLRSSGFSALDEAAVRAVEGARFVPPSPGSPKESYLAELIIRFQLKDS